MISEVGVAQSFHGLQGDPVEESHAGDATFIDGAKCDIGSCSRKAKAESPTSLIEFFSTFRCTFVELILTSLGAFAFLILLRAALLDALDELR